MTLRARLTAAFLAVVLGPVLLGAVFVGATVASVSHARSAERLDLAVTGVRTALGAACTRLAAAAESAALASRGGRDPAAAGAVVQQRLADGVRLVTPDGTVRSGLGDLPAPPWADCDAASMPGPPVACDALAAHVEMRDANGQPLGYAYAVQRLDAAFVRQLAGTAGAAVTVLPDDGALSTERGADRADVTATAERLRGNALGQTDGGRYVRRVDLAPGLPVPLVLSVARTDPRGLYAVLVAVVVGAGLLAVGAAWLLARSTTRPLTELAHAVDRFTAGDLSTRVPVRGTDEVGVLAGTFNRMTRELQGYVQALTASRDQLRGQLGLLGNTLSSTHDLDRILDVILQTALAATGAQAGVVLLLDPASGTLLGRSAEGLTTEGVPLSLGDVRVQLGEGLLGAVAASGEARRGRVDRDGPTLAPHEPRCRTYVALPFAAPEAGAPTEDSPAARGVLALYDRHGSDEFDDADLDTLRTFAGQAAVALDNVRVHKEAERLSLTDPLTGLSNYRFLTQALRREIERASRFNHTLAVLALDVDRFKDVNDTYGHAAGDAVLAEFARRVKGEIREVDFAFRQGGEEFVVLLPETDAPGGAVVAERLGAAVRRTPVIAAGSTGPQRIAVTVSIGIAVFPDHGGAGPEVLQAADDALYAAKTAGRDTYRVAPVPEPTVVETTAVVTVETPVYTLGGASNGTQPPRQSRGG